MAKRPSKAKQPKLTEEQSDALALTIAAKVHQGMRAFVVAGAEVLQSKHGWTQEQTAAWASDTVQLGGKYLQLEGEGQAQ